MRRLAMIGALLGALFVSSAATANAQFFYYRRPIGPVRAAVRAALPPYGYYYYGPRVFYRPYWGPAWGYYWW